MSINNWHGGKITILISLIDSIKTELNYSKVKLFFYNHFKQKAEYFLSVNKYIY